jgi:hypothetical protein
VRNKIIFAVLVLLMAIGGNIYQRSCIIGEVQSIELLDYSTISPVKSFTDSNSLYNIMKVLSKSSVLVEEKDAKLPTNVETSKEPPNYIAKVYNKDKSIRAILLWLPDERDNGFYTEGKNPGKWYQISHTGTRLLRKMAATSLITY